MLEHQPSATSRFTILHFIGSLWIARRSASRATGSARGGQERGEAGLADLRLEPPDVIGVLEDAAQGLVDERLVEVVGVERDERLRPVERLLVLGGPLAQIRVAQVAVPEVAELVRLLDAAGAAEAGRERGAGLVEPQLAGEQEPVDRGAPERDLEY